MQPRTHLLLLHISGSYHPLLSRGQQRYSSVSISHRRSQLSSGALNEQRNKVNYDVNTGNMSSPMMSRLRKLLLEGASLKSTRHLKVSKVRVLSVVWMDLTNLYSPDSLPLMLLTIRRDVSLSLVWKVALSPKWLGLDQMRAKERSVSPLTSTLQTLHCQQSTIYKSTGNQHQQLTYHFVYQLWIK